MPFASLIQKNSIFHPPPEIMCKPGYNRVKAIFFTVQFYLMMLCLSIFFEFVISIIPPSLHFQMSSLFFMAESSQGNIEVLMYLLS